VWVLRPAVGLELYVWRIPGYPFRVEEFRKEILGNAIED
jgi:hypothetical protein